MEKSNIYKSLYYLLSLISGFIEVGIFLYLFTIGIDLLWVLSAGVFYQCGLIFNNPLKLNRKIYMLFSMLSFIFIFPLGNNIIFFLVGIFLMSAPLQYSRKFLSSQIKINTLNKRIFRVSGFLISFLISPFTILISLIIVTISCIIINACFCPQKSQLVNVLKTKTNVLGMAMVFHQMHYFSYCYVLIIIFISYFKLPSYLCALWFSIGWISYLITPKIVRGEKYSRILVVGHIIIISSLFSIYILRSLSFVLVFWVTTGFGGGTVYCIEKMLKKKRNQKEINLELHENIGHFLGILIVSFVFAITKMLFLPFIFGAINALAVIMLVLLRGMLKNA